MVRGGLSSVSYRNEPSQKVVALARGAGLGGIEWSADTHAPHGDFRRAEGLLMETLRAGLTVTSYGSFYRLGENDDPVSGFSPVLDTARRLQASTIRVWPSFGRGSAVDAIVADGRAIGEKAGKFGITVCLEPHERSVIPDYRSLLETVGSTGHPFFKACWTQLPSGCRREEQWDAAAELAPYLGLAHIRNWTSDFDRKPLATADVCWTAVELMAEHNRVSVLDYWAVIEYLEDESAETLKREAGVLMEHIQAPVCPPKTH